MRIALALVLCVAGVGAAARQDDGFTTLFDGSSLEGWVNVNCAPDTFGVRDGVITVTGVPICEIRTERMYENFVLELEYQHQQPLGNAGVFIWADALPARGQPFLRAIEVQVLDGRNSETYTSHGDVFAIHGAVLTPDRPHPKGAMRSLPSERRAKGPGEWNHYRITADSGTIKLAVNGAEVSGGYDISPRKGYIALESEGAPVLFRNIRIRELPSRGTLPASHVASAYEGHVALYDGKSFSNWVVPQAQADRWRTDDWRIVHEPAGGHAASDAIVSAEEYGDIEVIADWRLVEAAPVPPAGPGVRQLTRRDLRAVVAPVGAPNVRAPGEWNRVVQRLVGNRVTATVNGQQTVDELVSELPRRGRIGLVPLNAKVEFANVFVRRLDR